jgi:hypothetical protein
MLDVGAHDAGRRFGAEGPRLGLVGPRGDPEQLLLDDVGDLADAPLEDRRLLEHRGLDAPVPIARREVGGEALQTRPAWRLGRQQVTGAARRAEVGHGAQSRS